MDTLSSTNAQVQVQRRSQSRDAGGSLVTRWPTVYHRLPVYIQQNRHAESQVAGGERQSINGIVKFPADVTITASDRIIWGTRTLQLTALTNVQDVAEFAEEQKAEWEEISNAGL